MEPIAGFNLCDPELIEDTCSGDSSKLNHCNCTGGLVVCQCSGGLTIPKPS
jgi:hypothetical protein